MTMQNPTVPNIAVKPNIWCDLEQTVESKEPYFLQDIIPGDLLVHFLGTRDSRTIRSTLTPIQNEEYEQSRFFQRHGQEGLSFEP